MMRKFGSIILAGLLFFTVMIVSGTAQTSQSIEGYLQEINGNEVTIEMYSGLAKVFTVTAGANLTIDQRPVPLTEFKPGMEVFGQFQGQTIIRLEGYATAVPGYLVPGGKMRNGTVTKIDRDQLTLRSTGGTAAYFTSSATIVRQNGKNVQLSSLRVGDSVKLYFDAADSTLISRMEIIGSSIEVKDLYKGKLASTDESQRTVTLQQVQVLRNGKWQTFASSLRLTYANERDSCFYIAGQQLAVRNLHYYNGKEVYTAVRDYFGRQQIAKAVVKERYETSYADKIDGINWYAQALELANKKNINFNEGTIMLKSGRLVDQSTLQPEDDARVLTDGQGSALTAAVIEVFNEAINNSNVGQYALYTGKLAETYVDHFVLDDFALLNGQAWESYSDKKEFGYDSDTQIHDWKNGLTVSADDFYTNDYGVDANGNRTNWFAYVYTDGDRAVGIAVQEDSDSLLKQRVTTGIIQTVEEDANVGWVLTLREAKDWSSRKDQWMVKSAPIRIGVDKTLLFKGDAKLEPSEFKVGERLYIVRDDFTAKVVIVK